MFVYVLYHIVLYHVFLHFGIIHMKYAIHCKRFVTLLLFFSFIVIYEGIKFVAI
jgi:hypothetical protein